MKDRINLLKKQLSQWEYEYYFLEEPTVSDFEYDNALKELIELENTYPQYKTLDSPTVRVGGVINKKFEKVNHSIPMLSLSNAFDENDLIKFDNDIKQVLPISTKYSYSVEPKIDGLSISLIYQDGYLFKAITRGDGEVGEDVTDNVKTIKSIPLKIKSLDKLEIRGEIFFTKKHFQELNNTLEKHFANARNAASGTIRNLDSSITSKRKLSAILYNLPDGLSRGFVKQDDVLLWLKDNHFQISKERFVANNINEVIKAIHWFNNHKNNIPYEIDGVVIKVNELNLHDEIGYTSKFPKWAIAYKFPPEIYCAKLLNISVTVGRTGRINYVGHIEKTLIDGTYVQNATLHNYEYIKTKDIKINDYVEIYKAGEIIPKIIRPIIEKRDGSQITFKIPKKCPSCGSELFQTPGEIDLYCINELCEKRMIEAINHFVSRKAMNIQGLSIKIIEKLFHHKIINNIIDIYKIEEKKETIITLDLQLKDKSINKLIHEINLSKNNSLEKLIFGLGIKHIGDVASKAIAKKYLDLKNIRNADFESLVMIDDVGEKMAESLIEYFKNPISLEIIDQFIAMKIANKYLSIWNEQEIKIENLKYKNSKVVITGSFEQSRSLIKNLLEGQYGIKVVSKVSKVVDYLLIGKNPTIKKIEEAKNLQIEIIDKPFWE
ncbi:MAG: NAD-dependent DNA ligase LigA [Mycoplasmoidaceae bacterium]